MTDIEKVIKELEWILEDDRFGLGVNWETGEPRDEEEKAGKIIADTIALLKEQEWISVKERLPNCNGCYIVWRPHFYPDKGMPSICYFDGSNTWHDSYGVDFTRTLAPEDVSHWKPLPEQPYKAVKCDDY